MTVTEFLRPEGWLGKGSGPRYVQLRRRIEAAIEQGILAPNSSLPPEREIAELTDLSRVTVRKAIHELVECGTDVQRGIVARAGMDELRALVERDGHHNLHADGMQRVCAQQTTPEDIARAIHLQ